MSSIRADVASAFRNWPGVAVRPACLAASETTLRIVRSDRRCPVRPRNSEAQRNYGTCYLTGTGVARSETQALAWWLIAKSNESDDKNGLPSWVFQSEAEADRSADALMRRLPAAQVEAAQALARAWRPKPE